MSSSSPTHPRRGRHIQLKQRNRRRFLRAAVTECNAVARRVEPRCPHFGECSGCQLQHLSYEAQLRYKQKIVREQLSRFGGIDERWSSRRFPRRPYESATRRVLGGTPRRRRFRPLEDRSSSPSTTATHGSAITRCSPRSKEDPPRHQIVVRHGVHTEKPWSSPGCPSSSPGRRSCTRSFSGGTSRFRPRVLSGEHNQRRSPTDPRRQARPAGR